MKFSVKWKTEKSEGNEIIEAERQNDAFMKIVTRLSQNEGDGIHPVPSKVEVRPIK